ncbi:dihydrofolate reductase family protein [Agreia pratensis]|uniref:Dihydrofolate reductase n=1 Tax=Agreia pratensis TaxID=150121 RepID=A0A1X7INN2_9MICO|nr:dihydrofolate reductase family protein [Agreia pratensis]SMG16279.1 Dihydrofolate reductase [Agreia pratensis]
MRRVTYSMSVSLDGFVRGPDGDFDWPGLSDEVFDIALDEIRDVGVHLMGRHLYEAMLYWETVDVAALAAPVQEWVNLWNALPKVVFSTTLSTVRGNARLADSGLADEIARLRAEPADGDIAIGGATLAAQAATLGLIDEYYMRVYPVLVGGGLPFFARDENRVDLELLETRAFDSGVAYLRHRVRR